MATNSGVVPAAARRAAWVARLGSAGMPRSPSSAAVPTSTRRPPTVAWMPRPGSASNCSAPSRSSPRVRAKVTIAAPSGCSEPTSAAAARRSTSSAGVPSAGMMLVTEGAPRVSVPVLSRTIVVMRRAASSASPPRIRIPSSAALPVPTMMAVGVARPSAHGQATISTAIAACSARVTSGRGTSTSQPTKVSSDRPRMAGTK